MLNELLNNVLLDPVSTVGLIVFYILLILFPLALVAAVNKTSSKFIRIFTIVCNLLLAFQLFLRWIIAGHFPISNLYESLCFLSWGLTIFQLFLENEYQSPIIPAITIPTVLFTLGFACFVLPDDLRLTSNLVPALRSSWLVMHVTVVMLSYAALILGSLLSASILLINIGQPLQIRSNSIGVGGVKFKNDSSLKDLLEPFEFSHSEKIDTLSYRSILVGFVLLSLG